MKAIITAGKSSPPKPINYIQNKHLIELGNTPLIFHALEQVAKSGIKDVGIIVEDGTQYIEKAVKNGGNFGLNITYIHQKGGPLGLAHAVYCAREFLGEEKFMVYLGDNIFDEDILAMRINFENSGANCLLALAKIPKPERFGVPEFDRQGKIIGIQERPIKPKSPYAVSGIYFYDKNVHKAFPHIKPSFRGIYEISDLHTWLAKNGYSVQYLEIKNWWKDRGHPLDLLEGNAMVLNKLKANNLGNVEPSVSIRGAVNIGKNTEIGGRTVIRGPVIIGEHCLIKNSYIGPYTSIGNKVEIHNGHIDHSIIYSGTSINTSKKIVDSLIGENTTISEAEHDTPAGNRLVVSENSIIAL